jgi:hypothetical protein
MSSLDNLTYETAQITLDDKGTGTEIAAILRYNNVGQSNVQPQNTIIIHRDGQNQQILAVSHLWEPLAYPLLFLHDTLGWGLCSNWANDTQEMEEELNGNVNI